MARLGRHLIAELFDCAPDILDDLPTVQTMLLTIAGHPRVTMAGSTFHQWSPRGLSGVVVMHEARLSIHTWPEHRYAAVDLFARDGALRLDAAIESVIAALAARRVSVLEVHRAIFPPALAPGVMAAAGSALATHQDGRATGQAEVLG